MNKKIIERLRARRKVAVDRMEELAKIETGENKRELNATEKAEFDRLKTQVAELDADLAELEKEPAPAPNPAPAASAADTTKLAADAANAELARVKGIQKVVKATLAMFPGLATGSVTAETLEAEFVDGRKSVDETRAALMSRIEAEQAKQPATTAQNRGGVTHDEREKFSAKMEAAILLRAEPQFARKNKTVEEMGREFAGLSLLEMAREYLTMAGIKVKGLSRDQVAKIALQGVHGAAEYFAGGLHSTSDFPNILANVANKTLRMGYEAAPRTFTMWARQVSAPDFKPINRVQLSDIAALREVGEHGEFKRRTISDSKETYSLATYGEIVGITRRVIVNDDLDALSRIPRAFGVSAAQMESDVVYALLTAGQTMTEDNVALFHANHANLNLTNGLDDDGLVEARRAMRVQTAPKGTLLNLMLKYIIVPAALEHVLEQLVNPLSLAADSVTNVIPAWMRSLTPVVEPRLDADSETTWYGATDNGIIDTVEYCYLEGQEGVYMETRQGFDVDGVELKARVDFAAAAIDFRGLCKNTQ